MKRLLPLAVLSLFAAAMGPALALEPSEIYFYVGTYTKPGGSQGIYKFILDTDTGTVIEQGLAAESKSPSFLAVRPGGKALYAVNETDGGAVSAFAIGEEGKLKALNHQPSRGERPCHLTVDATGKNVLVANYGSGSVAVLPISGLGGLGAATAFVQHTGSSINPQRQKEPHAHSIYTDASNTRAYACDLGLDKILIYRFDASKGTLTPNDPPNATVAPGSGPRHLAFHPQGRFAYVINEMGSTVTAFSHDAKTGALAEIGTVSTLPADFKGQSTTAEIFIHPNGKFLYGSNRGHDSIASFAIDAGTGKLTPIEHTPTDGKTPRNFALDPSGKYLLAANQDSDTISVFRVNADSGKLEATGQSLPVGAPVCVTFLPKQ